MKTISRSFAAGILIALAGTAVPALAATSINSCPANISTPGNYQLTANLACTITITASNVSVTLNGYTMTAPAGADGIDVNYTAGVGGGPGRLNHVAIEGPGLIIDNSDGFSGIFILNSDYSQVDLVTVKGSFGAGIDGYSDTFLTLGSNVLAGASTGGGYGAGLLIDYCTSCVISGNDASRNAGEGIFIGGGSANAVNNNTTNGNNIGIYVVQETGTRVSGNTTNGNAEVGIVVGGPGAVQVFSNSSSRANGIHDLVDETAACSGDSWSGNVFQTSADGATSPSACIH